MFCQIVPALRPRATASAREPLSVHTPAARPYAVAFAFSIASAWVRNVITDTTGPKISSTAIRLTGATSVNSVGGNQ